MTGASSTRETYPLGVSRPDLAVMDLPTPRRYSVFPASGLESW